MTPCEFLLDFSTFSVGGCWGQQILLFWKLVDETKISKPQDFRTLFKQILAYIFLSVRANSNVTFQYEILCTRVGQLSNDLHCAQPLRQKAFPVWFIKSQIFFLFMTWFTVLERMCVILWIAIYVKANNHTIFCLI